MAILSFKDRETKATFDGERPRGLSADVVRIGRRKLNMIDAATSLADLLAPPGNRLHALKADRDGQHAIRINDQFRICFRWTAQGAEDVEIVDYHD